MDLPTEMITEICKYLKWREVWNLEVAYPLTKLSGGKMDVLNRTLLLLENFMQITKLEIKELNKELKNHSNDYFICIVFYPNINVNEQLNMMFYVKSIISEKKRKLRKASTEYNSIKLWEQKTMFFMQTRQFVKQLIDMFCKVTYDVCYKE